MGAKGGVAADVTGVSGVTQLRMCRDEARTGTGGHDPAGIII
jgi:hypothetical protein